MCKNHYHHQMEEEREEEGKERRGERKERKEEAAEEEEENEIIEEEEREQGEEEGGEEGEEEEVEEEGGGGGEVEEGGGGGEEEEGGGGGEVEEGEGEGGEVELLTDENGWYREERLRWKYGTFINCDVRYFHFKSLGSEYDVVHLDPPWRLRGSELQATPRSMFTNSNFSLNYNTLTNEEIMDLDIGCLSSSGLIFLWVINSQLQLGLDCLKKWGYSYKDRVGILFFFFPFFILPSMGGALGGKGENILNICVNIYIYSILTMGKLGEMIIWGDILSVYLS